MTKSSIALILIAAGALSACSRPVIKEKETVIERPVVVAPATAPAAAGATTASCVYQAQTYTHSARSCQQGAEWVCTNGAWQRTNNSC